MNNPLAPPEGKRSRGNPNWGNKPLSPIPTLLTEFEIEVERLRLGRSQHGCLAGFIIWRIRAKRRMTANLNPIKAELQRRKHHRTTEVGAWLRKVVLGYTNTMPFRATRHSCVSLLLPSAGCRELYASRRSQRAQVGWDRLYPPLSRWASTTPCTTRLSHGPLRRHASFGKSRMRKRANTDLCGGGQ
jgi:hypothetical protein